MPDKRAERHYLDLLRRKWAAFPLGTLIEDERPDFLLNCGERVIGIEVTEIPVPHLPGQRPPQEQDKLRNQIVKAAACMHAAAGGEAVFVTVYFNDDAPLRKTDVDRCVNALAAFVSTPENERQGIRDRMPEEIDDVTVKYVAGYSCWQASSSGWLTPMSVPSLQGVIDRKEKMLGVARAKCDEVWLLIVNPPEGATSIELTNAAANAGYRNPFDRLFWLSLVGPYVVDLTPSPVPWFPEL